MNRDSKINRQILIFLSSHFFPRRTKRVKSFTAPTKPSVLDDGIEEEEEGDDDDDAIATFDPIKIQTPAKRANPGANPSNSSATPKRGTTVVDPELDAKKHIKALEKQMKSRMKSMKGRAVPVRDFRRDDQQSPLGDSAVEMPYQSLIDQVGPDDMNAEIRR